MPQSAMQAAAFFREVARHQTIWTVRDADGYPCPLNGDGIRVFPVWSSERRVRRIIAQVPAYADFVVVAMPWSELRDEWLSELEDDGYLVGLNWTGPRAAGYDVEPQSVRDRMAYALGHVPPDVPPVSSSTNSH
jgi:hypothetical protein